MLWEKWRDSPTKWMGFLPMGCFFFFYGENDDSSMDYQWIINGFKETFGVGTTW